MRADGSLFLSGVVIGAVLTAASLVYLDPVLLEVAWDNASPVELPTSSRWSGECGTAVEPHAELR